MAREPGQVTRRRSLILAGAQLGIFGLLGLRLYQLQVLEGPHYARRAEENRVARRMLVPQRGTIIDRRGDPLALNRVSYRLTVVPETFVPEEGGSLEAALEKAARLVPFSASHRARAQRSARGLAPFEPVVLRDDLDWDEVARISVAMADHDGMSIETANRRIYPLGAAAAHAVGYVARVSKDDMDGDPVLRLPDMRIGRTGVERTMDRFLRGFAGTSIIEVTSAGRRTRELDRRDDRAGGTLRLSLDGRLQRFAMERFGEETGSAVLLDIGTGDVLAMASAPSFEPGVFVDGIPQAEWRALLDDPYKPLIHRAVSGQYPPGSTFKMIVALAALEAGRIAPETTFFCSGKHRLGTGLFHCWRRGGHGHMNLHAAIQQSCDIYFYEAARLVGIDRIAAMSRRLGLGAPTGIELPGENAGQVPTKAWKRETYGRGWQAGDTLNAGIGQGFVLSTPLQLATFAARLASALQVVPRLALGPVRDFAPLDVRGDHLRIVLTAMRAVTGTRRGTAYAARIKDAGFEMAGKTGTSQVRRISRAERRRGLLKNEERPREERDHALFVGYAPVDRPRFATAVVVEHGGSGSKAAAPFARDLLLRVQREAASRS